MAWVAAFVICILSVSIVCPSAAYDGIACMHSQAEKSVRAEAKTPQLGDFGSIEDWLLKRLRSPGKTAIA